IINHITDKQITSFETEDAVLSLAISNNEQNLAYGLDSGILKIIETLPDHKELFFLDIGEAVWSLAFDHNNTHLMCGLDDNTIQRVSIKKKETKLLVKTTTSPYGLSLYDNDQIVYALYKKELTDFNTKNLSKSLLSEKFTKILTLACNYKSNILALGSKNGFLQLLN